MDNEKTLTREEWGKKPSYGDFPLCPDCGTLSTHPQPGCPCRSELGYHMLKYHHTCTNPTP